MPETRLAVVHHGVADVVAEHSASDVVQDLWERVQKWWWVQVLSFNKAPPEFIKKFRNFPSLLEKPACSKNFTKLLLSDLTIPPNYSTKYWYSGQPFYK